MAVGKSRKWSSSSKKLNQFFERVSQALNVCPQVESPQTEVALTDKALWSLGAVLTFLWAGQVPLFGALRTAKADPLYWFRDSLASHRGTLMELGVSPLVSSSLVLQLIVGSRLTYLDFRKKEDVIAFRTAQKLFALFICFGQAIAFISCGMYGDYDELGIINSTLIVIQLVLSGLMVIMLDELLQRGYGVSSGVTLFIAANMCQALMWSMIAPVAEDTFTGVQYYGALPGLFHLIISRKSTVDALKVAFYRSHLPNLSQLIATVLMFIAVIWFQGFRVELTVKSQKMRGNQSTTKYPIKLFYTSNIPVLLQMAFASNVHFFARIVSLFFGESNIIAAILGKWQTDRYGISRPVGGIVYYMTAPRRLVDLLLDPIQAVIYVGFVVITCGLCSLTWIDISGNSSRDVAKNLNDQGLVIRGFRESATVNVLEKYIPATAWTGGAILGILTVIADLFGALGGGSGILLTVTILFDIFESATREAYKQGYEIPGLPANNGGNPQ